MDTEEFTAMRQKVSCSNCAYCYLKPMFVGWKRKSVAQRALLHQAGFLPHKEVCTHDETSGLRVSKRFGLLARYGNCAKLNKDGRCSLFKPGRPMFEHFGDPAVSWGVPDNVLLYFWRRWS
jgi:hypothetical protein